MRREHPYRYLLLLLILLPFNLYASGDDSPEDPPHPLSVHFSPKHTAGFIGIDLGGGLTQEPRSVFNGSIHGGITFYYKDMQAELMNSVMGLFLNTSLYAGFDLNVSKKRIAWAPKIGVAQLLGPIIIGLETFFYTPSNFQEYDIRLYPFFGVSILNIVSLTAGPALHVGGTKIDQISSWRVYFTIRMPIELIRYFMGL
ncbi:hypothetical protein [Entomospira culicis]|uniref:Outer membrane protein beta-barrel domain-containing protein n=1 Tax=Entomospira culicis TaxID=2719989 RepID=A0A968GDJ4_9SPIO|nr:hypothetical protein [Entomospira culicis]NIZ18420.1 hypothetical protein [Entomospira culicis]NIZ68636.1 hypothetical protein [Entomospira culicis]WDI37236.1 hypothetical protein PVA46_00150 [Entomospira culicis]WDI38864.1 hypothetical protein PVA47_00160 [Entomospira culicis]